MANLSNISVDTVLGAVTTYAVPAVLALIVFFIGSKLAKGLSNAAQKALNRAPKSDPTVSKFLASILRYLILIITILAALGIVGVNTSGFTGMIVGLGAAFAFIMQGTLANFAAGVMIMMFHPFKVGDEVEIDGIKGVVTNIELTATRMKTRDNVELIVANGNAWGGIIRNHSSLGTRRLDMVFGVDYAADLDKAIQALMEIANSDKRIHQTPAPWAKVVNLGESSVDIELRVWCDYKDHRVLKMELSQPVKAAFDAAGVGIPYPHSIKIRTPVKQSKARDRVAKLTSMRPKA